MNDIPSLPEFTVSELEYLREVINKIIANKTILRIHEVGQISGKYHAPYSAIKGNMNTGLPLMYVIPGKEDKIPYTDGKSPFQNEQT